MQVVRKLHEKNELLAAIGRVQALLSSSHGQHLFEALLDEIMSLTHSECGFIGEIIHTSDKSPPALTIHARVGMDHIQTTLPLHNECSGESLTNVLLPLMGDPQKEKLFCAPILLGKLPVGAVCVGRNPTGYSPGLYKYLQPLLITFGQIMDVLRSKTPSYYHNPMSEEAQLSTEDHWRSMTANSPDHILSIGLDFNIRYVNHGPPNMTIEQLIGTSILNYVPPKYQDTAIACFNEVAKTGITGSYKSSFTNEGVTHYYDSRVGPIMRDGKVVGLVVNARDITESTLTEQKLRQSAVVVENSAEGIIVSDENNKIISVNRAFTTITGYSEQEVQGKSPRFLRSTKHDSGFYNAQWDTIYENKQWQGEIWNRRKDGSIFPAWLTITAIHNNHDELVNYVAVFSDISAIKQSQEKLDHLAYHDYLTDLPNRLLFNDRLKHAIQRAQRDNYEVAVLFIDLDRFKYINDTLGHPIGDKLIKQAANRLRNSVRKDDTVARIGGDEFVIAMEHPRASKGIITVAKKIVETFRYPVHIDNHALHITVSMGISIYPHDGRDVDTLIKNADIALYQVKEEGRNNFHFYTQEMTNTVLEHITLENSLRKALRQNEMCLHYQPQYNLKTQELIGCEALIRWLHPDKGLIFPAKLIPVAEESGLIIELGEWVLRTACQQMKTWLDQGKKIAHMSVNVSALQLKRESFIAELKSILKETGLPAHHLELELTETVVMHNAQWSVSLLEQLKGLGVTLSIDDFGTGYSSLGYLKRFPINKLKIDRSFVSDIPSDSNDTAITQAIIAMTQSLQLEVIAEGIENRQQLEFLTEHGCYLGQGFLLGKPLSSDEFSTSFL